MMTLARIQISRVLFLTVIACQGIASGQSLYEVVISLSDRQRVVNQQNQVSTYLNNQNNDPGDTDADLPEDYPIDWVGAGTNPAQSAVDGLDLGGKIAMLNQAVAEFDRLKYAFLNSSPGEFESGGIVGALKPHTSGDFEPLPRATPENYHEVLRLLAQRVRTLRLIQWPAAFRQKSFTDKTDIWEEVDYNDPQDSNNDDNYEPFVKIVMPEGTTPPASVDWTPDSIGSGNLEVDISDPWTSVTSYLASQIQVSGNYVERPSWVEEITAPLRSQWLQLSGIYPEEARVSATAPGGDGTQIGGTVYVLRRSNWHQIDIDGASSRYEENEAGYIVEGSSASGIVLLFGSPPTATVNGSWITTWEYSDEYGGYLDQTFVEGGYQHKEAWTLPYDDEGHSDDYTNSYEKNWKIGCNFYPVFKPTFTRGVDAATMRPKLESADLVLAQNVADGNLLLHPRPSLLFGIELGPGLKGAGNGYVSAGAMESGYYGYYGYYGWYWDDWNSMMRFDSSYSLQFAGSHSDYHVVYDNDRSDRSQSLPADSIGWPYTDTGDITRHDTTTLYRAWDSPRLKQVAGRDLVADITYNANHYGGYTVKIYRRPTGSAVLTPGQAMNLSGMPLIRTWTFSHPGGSTPHPTDAEKLEAAGSGGEKYEIQANEILPNQGLGWAYWYYYSYDWWWWTEGTHSWTLKLSQGATEKFKKEIEITASTAENESFVWDVALRESLDGQLISSLSSMTLNPFNDSFPADWTITSAGKTITGSATLGDYQDPATRYGALPTSVSVDYDGIQSDLSTTWNTNGLLASLTQGQWATTGTASGDTYTLTHKLNGSPFATTWTEFLDGGNKMKTYSAPDGTAGNKSDSSVAWSEVEYGKASSGLPGLPRIIKKSDGSGATYDWNASGDGSYILTLEEGLLSSNSVSRGTRLIQNVNTRGYPTQTEFFEIYGGAVKTGGTTFSNMTGWGTPKKGTDYRTGLDSTWTYDANLTRLSTHTSYLGVASELSGYDVLGRPATISSNGISSAKTYNAFSTSSTITGSATGSISETRDTLGRLTSSNTTWNSVTDNLTVTPNTSPVAITRTQSLLGTHNSTVRKDDGAVAATSGPTLPFGGTEGTALAVEDGLLSTKSELGEQANAYRTTWTDAWGRVCKTETSSTAPSDTDATGFLYSDPDSTLKRVRVTQASGRVLITESDPYNTSGMIRRSGIDVNGNGSLGTSDRFVESVTTVSGGTLVTTLSLTEDTGLREILRTAWTPSGGQTVTTINGSEETITRTPNYTAKTVTTSSTKGWSKTDTFNNLGLTTNSTLSGTGVPSAALTPVWRDDGSLSGVTFTAGGDTHSASFNNDGTLATLTAPGKGNILGGHSVSGGSETLTVDGVTTVTKLDGTETATSGGDVIGKTEVLATNGSGFKQTTTPTVGAATEVTLNAAGAPTAKAYAAGAGESRQYLSGGLLEKISLARGGDLILGYSNDGAKDLVSATWPVVSSGEFGNIPAVTAGYGYDRAGRVDEIGDSSGTRTITWQNGRATGSAYTGGPLSGYQVLTPRNTQGTGTGCTAKRGSVTLHSATRVPNGASGEVSEIISGDVKIVINRNAARQVTGFQCGNTTGTFVPVVTQTWERGPGGRIEYAGSNITGAPSFDYLINPAAPEESFDAKGRRLNCATAGGQWTYQYTNGQLSSALHPTLGNFSYQFDRIGRRTDMGTANISDVLNRTLAWTNNQNKTLKIAAHPDARVWVGIGTATPAEIPSFTGAYSYPITPPGSSGGWVAWNTLAVLEGEGDAGANPDAKAEQSGAVWVPPVSESFTFDAAGNRESSALWNYGWDAKNQLVRARTKDHTSTAQGFDVTNAYDSEGLRFSKKVNRYQNGAVVEQKVITFLHDGDDLIYERHQLPSGLTTLERKYVWGPDISGIHGGAGGAGGLLLIRETKGNSTIDLYPLYDGGGHVVALADASGVLQAEYAYSPFGESIYARGPYASSCPFRFQAKYLDQETGLYMFKHRPYDPITGQFLSRDPLGEKESINLYQLTGGDPINYVDRDGLAKVALDGKGNLTAIGQIILDIAKGDPNAARSLLMTKQMDAETAGIAVAGDGGEDSIRNVTRAIETAIGNAQEDGRDEWKMIAAKAGLSGERYFGGYKDAWMSAKLAEYAPQIAANAGAALELRAAERAMNDKATAYQNSAAYKLREFADVPFDVAAFGISAGAATDVTTGNAVTWNSWNNGGGFGLAEITPGERVFAASLVAFGPVSRGAGFVDDFVDDFVRVGARGRSFAGTALKPWGAKVVTRWGPATGAGPLGEEVAGTFRGGSYTEMLTQEVTTLYRAYGGKAGALSPYWSRTPPAGPLQAQIDSALLPKWGNTAENLSSIIVPKGTRIFEGFVAPQGGLLGGGIQVYIPKVDPSWLVK